MIHQVFAEKVIDRVRYAQAIKEFTQLGNNGLSLAEALALTRIPQVMSNVNDDQLQLFQKLVGGHAVLKVYSKKSPQELELEAEALVLTEKKKKLDEALEWLHSQPEDVKEKVNLLLQGSHSPPTA
jgi:hypothetical protein